MANRPPHEGAPRFGWNRAACIALIVVSTGLTAGASGVAGSEVVEPRGAVIEPVIEQVSPSPDGQWIAVRTAGSTPREHGLWIADLATGEVRPVAEQPPAGSRLTWEGGLLRAEIADPHLARREMRWLEPATAEVVRTARSTPLLEAEDRAEPGKGWASVEDRSHARGKRVCEIAWLDRELAFAVTEHTDLRWQITTLPGVVFYATRDHGVTRVMRWDFEREWASEITTLAGPEAKWEVSPDGTRLRVDDGERAYVVDAADGSAIAGPFRSGELRWLESEVSRFLLLTVGGHHYLVDTALDRQLHVARATASKTEVFVLPDERFVLRMDDRLQLLDRDAAPLGQLLPIARAAH